MKEITVENFSYSDIKEWIKDWTRNQKVELAIYSAELVVHLDRTGTAQPAIDAAKECLKNPTKENKELCKKAADAAAADADAAAATYAADAAAADADAAAATYAAAAADADAAATTYADAAAATYAAAAAAAATYAAAAADAAAAKTKENIINFIKNVGTMTKQEKIMAYCRAQADVAAAMKLLNQRKAEANQAESNILADVELVHILETKGVCDFMNYYKVIDGRIVTTEYVDINFLDKDGE